jgi:hypothetical protein
MPSAERPPPAPEDAQLFRLKHSVREGELSARRTPFTVLSGLLVAAAGGVLIAGATLPWVSIAGVSTAAVREGGPDGAAASWCVAVGAAWIGLGLFGAVGRRGRPRFIHWLTWLLAPLTWALVNYRSAILGQLVVVHNADLRSEGLAVVGSGIAVIDAAVALGLAAPLLSLRQAWRVLRT